MLFRKNTAETAVPKPEPKLEWRESSSLSQSIMVEVTNWRYKVFPSMESKSWGSWMFEFGGQTDIGLLKGLTVVGNIEVFEPGKEIYMVSKFWKNIPEHVEGHGYLQYDKNDMPVMASVALNLYCKAEALDWVYRAFLCSLASAQGGLLIDVNITFPDPMGPHFWKDEWRDREWEVASWKLYAAASRPIVRDAR